MLKSLLSPKKLRPKKEVQKKSVPARRFNEMIDYYTCELKSRLSQISRLKKENEILIKTSLRNSERTKGLQEENAKLRSRLRQG